MKFLLFLGLVGTYQDHFTFITNLETFEVLSIQVTTCKPFCTRIFEPTFFRTFCAEVILAFTAPQDEALFLKNLRESERVTTFVTANSFVVISNPIFSACRFFQKVSFITVEQNRNFFFLLILLLSTLTMHNYLRIISKGDVFLPID